MITPLWATGDWEGLPPTRPNHLLTISSIMFIFVLIFNSAIVIFNCYLVWRIIRIKQYLTRFANRLENLEKRIPLTLKLIQLNLRTREYQSLKARRTYELLQQKWEILLTLLQVLKRFSRQSQS